MSIESGKVMNAKVAILQAVEGACAEAVTKNGDFHMQPVWRAVDALIQTVRAEKLTRVDAIEMLANNVFATRRKPNQVEYHVNALLEQVKYLRRESLEAQTSAQVTRND